MSAKVLTSTLPVLLGLMCALAANFPVTVFGGWIPSPLLALMPVYFWGLVRPDLMSCGWAFALGLVQDFLSGGPFGIWALAFVMMYAVIDKQRDSFAGLSGWAAILGFSCAALLTSVMAFATFSICYWKLLPLSPFAVQFAVTVVLYVPAAVVFGFVHRRFVGPYRDEI